MHTFRYTTFFVPLWREDASSEKKKIKEQDLIDVMDEKGADGWCIYQEDVTGEGILLHARKQLT